MRSSNKYRARRIPGAILYLCIVGYIFRDTQWPPSPANLVVGPLILILLGVIFLSGFLFQYVEFAQEADKLYMNYRDGWFGARKIDVAKIEKVIDLNRLIPLIRLYYNTDKDRM